MSVASGISRDGSSQHDADEDGSQVSMIYRLLVSFALLCKTIKHLNQEKMYNSRRPDADRALARVLLANQARI